MTWPQHAIWSVIRWEGENAHTRNVSTVWHLPQSTTVEGVVDTFTALLRTCETLRTTFSQAGQGWPDQLVHGSGAIVVHHYQTTADAADACTERVHRELRRTCFDLSADMPLVIGIVSVGDRAHSAVAVLSHVAVDGQSLMILRRMFEEVLHGGPDALDGSAGPAEQPLDLAGYEQSPAGKAMGQQAIGFWRETFAEVPTIMFAGGPEQESRIERAQMSSPTMARAVRQISVRERVSNSAVVLGAAALVLSSILDTPDIALRTLIATRFRPKARYSIAALNLNGLFRVQVEAGSAGSHFRRSSTASLLAIRRSHYDPAELETELDRVMLGRGVPAKQYMFFNDMSSPHESDAYETGRADDATRIWTIDDDRPDKDSKLLLKVFSIAETASLSLYLDRRFLPRGPAEILRSLEWVTSEAARDADATVTDLLRRCC